MSPTDNKWISYVSIARPDHWVKHVFILPGVLGALALTPLNLSVLEITFNFFIGLASACLIASANYVINEWLDAEFDRNHPEKATRAAAVGLIKPLWVYVEYSVLAICGFALAYCINTVFFWASLAFFVSGITYNVKPVRTKDRVYLDVISEAINNPIRLILGWAMVSGNTIPPISLIIAYWAGGAFLMAAKRLSEYSFIVAKKGQSGPGLYRRSFAYYSIASLNISCFVYALSCSFFIAVFFVKYRAELILSFPIIVALFGYYLRLAMQPMSFAQKPELLHRDLRLVALALALALAITLLAFINMPFVEYIFQIRFVELHID
jgi:decaprenyl-phosphate phosphoribosyltransferase